ncbi:WXG100 family type VII secretion target [Nocardia sp. NPDC058658]|uniref:WXG100 family type VII secretion target n=1 Tax=Nocardia sp. NPDC058658 TaxID=3346580 RepID=UPI003653E103
MSGESSAAETDFAMVPAEVTDAGVYIEQVAASLLTGLASLDREISGALGTWTGAAADSFGAGWTTTKDGAANVLAALNAMGELLGVASKAVASQDTLNADNLSSLDLPKLDL